MQESLIFLYDEGTAMGKGNLLWLIVALKLTQMDSKYLLVKLEGERQYANGSNDYIDAPFYHSEYPKAQGRIPKLLSTNYHGIIIFAL